MFNPEKSWVVAFAGMDDDGENVIVRYPSWMFFHQDALMEIWRICASSQSMQLTLPGTLRYKKWFCTASACAALIACACNSITGVLSDVERQILDLEMEHALSKRVMLGIIRATRAAAAGHGPDIRSFHILKTAKEDILFRLVSDAHLSVAVECIQV